jgi:hypothetical protein
VASVAGKPPAGVGGKKTIWSVKPADALLKDVEAYGMRHSRLRRGEAVGDPEKELEKG